MFVLPVNLFKVYCLDVCRQQTCCTSRWHRNITTSDRCTGGNTRGKRHESSLISLSSPLTFLLTNSISSFADDIVNYLLPYCVTFSLSLFVSPPPPPHLMTSPLVPTKVICAVCVLLGTQNCILCLFLFSLFTICIFTSYYWNGISLV